MYIIYYELNFFMFGEKLLIKGEAQNKLCVIGLETKINKFMLLSLQTN